MKAMVVGLGRVGWHYSLEKGRGFSASHLGAYYGHKDVDTVIAVDSDEKRLSECARWLGRVHRTPKKKTMFASDPAEAIKKWKPEIASVCVPTPSHSQVMRAMCQERDGPRVICLEKPVALSLREAEGVADEVATAYSKYGKPKVAVNFTRRWDDRYVQVKSLIDKGRIGKPLLAIGLHPGPLLRSGIHMLDLFNWYLGETESVSGLVEAEDNWMTQAYSGTNDWNGSGLIHYKNGSYAALANMGLNKPGFVLFELYIHGEKGAIKIEDNGRLVRFQSLARSQHYSGLRELVTLRESKPKKRKSMDPMARMVNDLVQCAKNPAAIPQCTLRDAVNAQRLVHLIRQSSGKRSVRLSPEEVDLSETIMSH
jgi:predicted dehydrogenase